MTKSRKIQILLLAVALVLSCLFSCFFTNTTLTCYASGISVDGGYSGVMQDLMQDGSFNADDYAIDEKDYSLQVITIAESKDNELFVYVYQPSSHYLNFSATSINISTAIGKDLKFYNLKLRYVNSSGVFYKYVVEDFKVKTDTVRYYEISSIFRNWYKDFDKDVDKKTDNSIDEVSFAVGKQFKFTTSESGGISMSVEDVETITITNKFVGYIRYNNGFKWFASYCNAYYVAFSTDRQIDTLLEADIFYTEHEYTESYLFGGKVSTSNGKSVNKYAYLKYSDVAHNTNKGLFASDESWKRIRDVETFISEEDLTTETENNLKGLDWVLNFTETEVLKSPITNGSQQIHGSVVEDVSILRLAFITNGEYHNLGVIDNKQTGSLDPTNKTGDNLFGIIIAIILLILLLVVLAPFIPAILRVISAPFRAIRKMASKKNKK